MRKSIIFLLMLVIISPVSAVIIDGQSDYQTSEFGYYHMLTGGKFPTGNTPNGHGDSGGTIRYITDSPAWGHPLNSWHKDYWFEENASFALTLKNNGQIIYDNAGIEDGTYGTYYNAQEQGLEDAPGLYRAYSMSNNYDMIYAGYFKLNETTTIDNLIGYFSGSAGFDPSNPAIGYRFNIWSSYQDMPDTNPNSYMPTENSFIGDILSSDNTTGVFSWGDTGVDRVWANGTTDDIFRLTYTLETPITLEAGEYFFGHDATVPEPTTIALLGLGGLALIRKKRNA